MESINRDKKTPFYHQLKEIFIDQIEKHRLKPGEKIPSERELSENYNVSRTTARNALLALAQEGLVIRITGKGTYLSEKSQYRKQTKKTGNIGFIRCKHHNIGDQPFAADLFYSEIFNGVQEEISKQFYHLLFSYVRENNKEDLASLEAFLGKVDGLILGETRSKALVNSLEKHGLPMVLVSPSVEGDKIDSVQIDNLGGARQAVVHLIDLGHRRVGMINGPLNTYPALERFEGYKKALASRGLRFDKDLVVEGDWHVESGQKAMRMLLDRCDNLTAVFAANDMMAMGVIKAVEEAGLSVPGDVSVIGFDDISTAAFTNPPLTTMKVHKSELGRLAAKRLLQRIEFEKLPQIKTFISSELIKRESCCRLRR